MNDLPILVLSKIFSYLSLQQRLKLRLVSKLWKLLLEEIHQKILCVCVSGCSLKVRYDEEDIVEVSEFSEVWNFHYFRNPDVIEKVKKLIFLNDRHRSNFLPDLNLFSQLEVLKIYRGMINWPEDTRNLTWNLANLRTLGFIDAGFSIKIKVNSRNQRNLIFYNYPYRRGKIVVEQPKKVKFLHCLYFNWDFNDFNYLEHLIAMEMDMPVFLFTRLKRVEVFSSVLIRSPQPAIQSLEKYRNRFPTDLEVFMNGFAYPPPDKVLEMRNGCSYYGYFFNKERLKVMLDNFSRIVLPFPWRTHIDYDSDSSFPDAFFVLFNQIDSVDVKSNVDTERLIRFLQKAAIVEELQLCHGSWTNASTINCR